MQQSDYREQWGRLVERSAELQDQRDSLENDLSEIKSEIAHLDAVLGHLRTLAGMPKDEDIATLGITDAIRHILKNSNERMSATDVRLALKSKGFDLTKYSAPMSSIYKVLGRLADDDSSQVCREKDDGGGVFYRWAVDDFAQSAEIGDDDIPF
jgi:hypothetical protein